MSLWLMNSQNTQTYFHLDKQIGPAVSNYLQTICSIIARKYNMANTPAVFDIVDWQQHDTARLSQPRRDSVTWAWTFGKNWAVFHSSVLAVQ